MSAARWLQEFSSLALSLLGATLGWVLLAPMAALVPKRRDWVAVIGRQHGRFLDNAKYFFLEAATGSTGLRVVFISERRDVVAAVSGHGFQAMRYPGPGAILYLMRCGTVVVDSTDWIRHLRRFLVIRSRIVQLWHGVAFKRIELDKWRHETGRYRWVSTPLVFALRLILYRATGRLVRYDAVCSTSRFYRDEVFIPAFLAHEFPITGYPRNGFAQTLRGRGRELAWSNVDERIRRCLEGWHATHRRLILIAPTMRDSFSVPMQLDDATVGRLDNFAAAHGIEFLFKFHPSERHAHSVAGIHLHVCKPDADIYPLLPHCSALVTDYSSIYMDFLLLDRPVLFLTPDGDRYMREDRQVQFDPASMMPGPRLVDWDTLLEALASVRTDDSYAVERERLLRMAFDDQPQTDATTKLLHFMGEQQWIKK